MNSSGESAFGSHQISTLMSCELKWVLKYVLGYRPKGVNKNTLRGTLFHVMLHQYLSEHAKGPQQPFTAGEMEMELEELAAPVPYLLKQVREYFEWYKQRENFDDLDRIPFLFEHELKFPVLGEFVTCRVDALYQDTETKLFEIDDHKTSTINSPAVTRWVTSLQPYVNWLAVEHEFGEVSKFNINFCVVGFDPADNHQERLTLPVEKAVLLDTTEHLKRAVDKRESVKARFNQGLPIYDEGRANGSCFGKYGSCLFAEYCYAPEDRKDAVLNSQYETRED